MASKPNKRKIFNRNKIVLTGDQKEKIKEKFYAKFTVEDISRNLNIPERFVREYVDGNLITFNGKDGSECLEIITNKIGSYPSGELREKITTKNVALQEQIFQLTEKEQGCVKKYFLKFEESKDFFEVDENLSMEAKNCIRASSIKDVENLSIKLKRVQKVIRNYLLRYYPDESLKPFDIEQQVRQIRSLVEIFKRDELISHTNYRMVISESCSDLNSIQRPNILLNKLLPLVFYYLKCSLPLEEIPETITNITYIPLTTLDIFHLILQMSDPIVRGFCIEHYSFSNPVPFYYPRVGPYEDQACCQFEICKELWYSVQQFNGLVSFGLGWASWNPVGKSNILDLMFETDFVKGSPQNSAFHLGSIDIQMTKNLFGAKKKNVNEPTNWAYIDCHGYSDMKMITEVCQNLDIALVHVTYTDFTNENNYIRLNQDLHKITNNTRHVYVLVRDCPGNVVIEEQPLIIDGKTCEVIFIPNLVEHSNLSAHLKKQGYTILHSETENLRCVNDIFFENVLESSNNGNDFKEKKQLIEHIMVHIRSDEKDKFNSLSYYPHFVEYMQCYYKALNAIDLKVIDEQNKKCLELVKKLNKVKMSEIVCFFDEILSKEDSALLLWKLSEELKNLGIGYTIEILWREALLSNRYDKKNRFPKTFGSHFSKYVESGEPFELIDGDNLRYFNQDIDSLLSDYYERQSQMCYSINSNPHLFKNPPIVISIFGPQSSGKSTILNYCFGCKFLTSAGRCTQGVYGSLSKLSQPINNSDHFLILDTEGLDSFEKRKIVKQTTCIQFDRTMVLFCLAVSQVVIICVRGNFGEGMKKLFQICVYSLVKLRVGKVAAPKILFVLNQQSDTDTSKHSNAINAIINDLNKDASLIEDLPKGLTVSDLIQASTENLFILPSAFNTDCVNSQMEKLFDTDLCKLSPTTSFANKCTDLRIAIIKGLKNGGDFKNMRPFTTMREWMLMSGVIWDTTVRYQDIVKYKNVDELRSRNILFGILTELLEDEIYSQKVENMRITDEIILNRVKNIKSWSCPEKLFERLVKMLAVTFEQNEDKTLVLFEKKCNENHLLRRMEYMCKDAKFNLRRLILIENKIYTDMLKFEIRVHMSEIKLSENMARFLMETEESIDEYSKLSVEEQMGKFDKIWKKTFINPDKEEELAEREAMFSDMYTVFSVESKTMENKKTIYKLFFDLDFDMGKIIEKLGEEIVENFCTEPQEFSENDSFLYHWIENKVLIKDLNAETCQYLSKGSFYLPVVDPNSGINLNLTFQDWVPSECYSLIKYCSGYFNDPDIQWDPPKRIQVLELASQLKDPNNFNKSTWEKFINNIKEGIEMIIKKELNVSHSTIMEIVNFLCSTCKVINHEIGCIEAKLTNKAERRLTTFALAHAIRAISQSIKEEMDGKTIEIKIKKTNSDYFLQKMEDPKIDREGWDRERLRTGDKITARKFAGDLLEFLWKNVNDNWQRRGYDKYFKEKRDTLSHKKLLLLANEEIEKELMNNSDNNPITEDNFVVQFICNHSQNQKRLFQKEWQKVANNLYGTILDDMKKNFTEHLLTLLDSLQGFLNGMVSQCEKLGTVDEIQFDSDSNFVISSETSCNETNELASEVNSFRRAPSKAMVLYLKMYLDPNVSAQEFETFFNNEFKVDRFPVRKSPKNCLLCKRTDNHVPVLEEIFKRLINLNVFSNTQKIFNIKVYIEEFLLMKTNYEPQLTQSNYEKLLESTKQKFQRCVINCPNQCPSCGKFCEKEIHPHSGVCQILTGHQICSMGGKVWNTNKDKTAILLMCEDYEEDSPVLIPGCNMKWWEFKEKCGGNWDWTLPQDEMFASLQIVNREKIKNIWNKFGKAILDYYTKNGAQINYIPYTSLELIKKSLFSLNSYVCFVIDATKLMGYDIKYVKHWVSEHMKILEGVSNFRVVVYHGHCLDKNFIETFPNNSDFTSEKKQIQKFLDKMSIYGDQDDEYALLHGLATAITGSNWETGFEIRNILVHIYMEPTMGYTKPFIAKDKCLHGCSFNWEEDIIIKMNELKIIYKRELIIGRNHPDRHLAKLINYDNKSIDLSPEKKFKSEVFINYKPDK